MNIMRHYLVPTTVRYTYVLGEVSVIISKKYQVPVDALDGQDAAEIVDKMFVDEIEELCSGDYVAWIDNIEGDNENLWSKESVDTIEETANFEPTQKIISNVDYAYET
jgi:hypothetical protein